MRRWTNQDGMLLTELGIKRGFKINFNHGAIFNLIYSWINQDDYRKKPKSIEIDGAKFYWISYQKILDDLPALCIKTKQTLADNYIAKLVEAGFLYKHISKKNGNKTYFRIADIIYDIMDADDNTDGKWMQDVINKPTEPVSAEPEPLPLETYIAETKETAEVVEPEIMQPYQEEVEKLYNELKKYNPNMDPPNYKKDCTQLRLLAKKVGEELFQSVLAWYILHLKDEDIYMPVAKCSTSFRKKFDQIFKKMQRDTTWKKSTKKGKEERTSDVMDNFMKWDENNGII